MTGSIIIVFLGYGLLAGLGAGLAYNAVLSAVSGIIFGGLFDKIGYKATLIIALFIKKPDSAQAAQQQ